MKTALALLLAVWMTSINSASAQQAGTSDEPKKETGATSASESKPKTGAQADLEAKFKAMLTKATLSGRWSPVTSGQLGPEKPEDKYFIQSAKKLGEDSWLISAGMSADNPAMVLPIPVQVKWSGDTAVIVVQDLSMGKDRSYSARVLFFDDTYAGTWTSSSGYGGLIYGTISRDPTSPGKPAESKPNVPKP